MIRRVIVLALVAGQAWGQWQHWDITNGQPYTNTMALDLYDALEEREWVLNGTNAALTGAGFADEVEVWAGTDTYVTVTLTGRDRFLPFISTNNGVITTNVPHLTRDAIGDMDIILADMLHGGDLYFLPWRLATGGTFVAYLNALHTNAYPNYPNNLPLLTSLNAGKYAGFTNSHDMFLYKSTVTNDYGYITGYAYPATGPAITQSQPIAEAWWNRVPWQNDTPGAAWTNRGPFRGGTTWNWGYADYTNRPRVHRRQNGTNDMGTSTLWIRGSIATWRDDSQDEYWETVSAVESVAITGEWQQATGAWVNVTVLTNSTPGSNYGDSFTLIYDQPFRYYDQFGGNAMGLDTLNRRAFADYFMSRYRLLNEMRWTGQTWPDGEAGNAIKQYDPSETRIAESGCGAGCALTNQIWLWGGSTWNNAGVYDSEVYFVGTYGSTDGSYYKGARKRTSPSWVVRTTNTASAVDVYVRFYMPYLTSPVNQKFNDIDALGVTNYEATLWYTIPATNATNRVAACIGCTDTNPVEIYATTNYLEGVDGKIVGVAFKWDFKFLTNAP